MRRISRFFPCSSGTAWPPRGGWPGLLVRELVFTLNMDGWPLVTGKDGVGGRAVRERSCHVDSIRENGSRDVRLPS
ncbi:hypothetical protein GBAR_LOCUS21618 [Geodia barretti]|uniref:Uncharacterized protein n=1 Tax=Geodia barretti TaxID=519541 RepID=A0AA35SZ33_GEOBA|nr:hypothetical protein GBAR_LOCUS21618 [Geodia barretti]